MANFGIGFTVGFFTAVLVIRFISQAEILEVIERHLIEFASEAAREAAHAASEAMREDLLKESYKLKFWYVNADVLKLDDLKEAVIQLSPDSAKWLARHDAAVSAKAALVEHMKACPECEKHVIDGLSSTFCMRGFDLIHIRDKAEAEAK